MGAARKRMKLKQGMLSKTFHGLVLGDRFSASAFRDDGHPFAVARVASNVGFDAAGGRGRLPIDECEIRLIDFPQTELILQPAVSAFILCEQDQARGLFVQSMNNTWTFLAADSFDVRLIAQYGIDQGSRSMSCRGMDHHACRFVNDNQIFILEDDIERNIFSDQICGRGWRHSNCHLGPAFKGLTSFFRGATVHLYKTLGNQALDARTRKLLQPPDQKFIEPVRSRLVKTKI